MIYQFDQLSQFCAFLRQRSIAAVKSKVPYIELEDASTSFLSRLYYNAHEVEESEIKRLQTKDQKRSSNILGHDIFSDVEEEINPDTIYMCQEALDIIEKVWEEQKQLFDTMQIRISHLNDQNANSNSSTNDFSQIQMRFDYVSPVEWASTICHEISHQYLFFKWSTLNPEYIDPTKWKQTTYSAIRKTERPMTGIYLALFAEATMLELFFRIKHYAKTHPSKQWQQYLEDGQAYIFVPVEKYYHTEYQSFLDNPWMQEIFPELTEFFHETALKTDACRTP